METHRGVVSDLNVLVDMSASTQKKFSGRIEKVSYDVVLGEGR